MLTALKIVAGFLVVVLVAFVAIRPDAERPQQLECAIEEDVAIETAVVVELSDDPVVGLPPSDAAVIPHRDSEAAPRQTLARAAALQEASGDRPAERRGLVGPSAWPSDPVAGQPWWLRWPASDLQLVVVAQRATRQVELSAAWSPS